MKYYPAKVGKTGKEVHAGRVVGTVQKAGRNVEMLTHVCGLVNTRNINNHPRIVRLPDENVITCERCRKAMIADAAKEQPMIDIVCFGCNKPMGQKPGIPSSKPTSTLCPECDAKWYATLEERKRLLCVGHVEPANREIVIVEAKARKEPNVP